MQAGKAPGNHGQFAPQRASARNPDRNGLSRFIKRAVQQKMDRLLDDLPGQDQPEMTDRHHQMVGDTRQPGFLIRDHTVVRFLEAPGE